MLLDEYDTPIHAGWLKGYYEKAINFMRGFLSGVLKDNIYLEKGILTGPNNITVAGILGRKFRNRFGFTPEECEKLLRVVGLKIDMTREWIGIMGIILRVRSF